MNKEESLFMLLDDIWHRSLNDRIEEDNEAMEKRIKRMHLIIDSLPPRCKRIIQMNKMEGVKYKDIASILGISIKTVEAQMSVAFKKIRKGFENDNMVLFFIRSLKRVLEPIR